jgi:hypothetical protein
MAPLGDYGGPTETMALLPGSAAIGKGIATDYPGTITPITTDQRGMPLDTPPDIFPWRIVSGRSSVGYVRADVASYIMAPRPRRMRSGMTFVRGPGTIAAYGDTKSPLRLGVPRRAVREIISMCPCIG